MATSKEFTKKARSASSDSTLQPNNENATAPLPLLKFGKYDVVKELGRGGMGVVYKARDGELGRMVALKTLLVAEDTDGLKTARFLQEAQALASLHHPNVVQIYDMGQQEGIPFFVMEYVEGETLDKKIARGMPAKEALEIMETVAKAVAYVHGQNLLHRDLKPGNIMIDQNGIVKVMDFGLTKSIESEQKLSQEGMAVGTAGYIAPEQLDGNAQECSDVYSLGVILYQMLTDTLPFTGSSPTSILWKQLSGPATPPSYHNAKVSKDVDTIALKAFEYEAAHRYPTAQALAEDIRRYLDGQPIAARPVRFYERLWRTIRRNPKISALVTVSMALGIFGLVTILTPNIPLKERLAQKERQLTPGLPMASQREAAQLLNDVTLLLQHREQTPAMTARTYFLRAQIYELLGEYEAASSDYENACQARWEKDAEAKRRKYVCAYYPLAKKLNQKERELEERLAGMSSDQVNPVLEELNAILAIPHPQLTSFTQAQTHFLRAQALARLAKLHNDPEKREAAYRAAAEDYLSASKIEWPKAALAQEQARICQCYFTSLNEVLKQRLALEQEITIDYLEQQIAVLGKSQLNKWREELTFLLLHHPQKDEQTTGELLFLRGLVYERLQQSDLARADFSQGRAHLQKILATASEQETIVKASTMLMQMAFKEGEWQKVSDYFRKAYEKKLGQWGYQDQEFRPLAAILLAMAQELVVQKNYEVAQKWLKIAKNWLQDDEATRWSYRYTTRVVFFYTQIYRKPASNPTAWSNMKGMFDQLCQQGSPEYQGPALIFLAYLYLKTGDVKEAVRCAKQATRNGFRFSDHPECGELLQDEAFKKLVEENN
jgi:serine/threonine protein kinase